MPVVGTEDGPRRRVLESLYGEALLLSDETHGYFESAGMAAREALEAPDRLRFACEALKATTRLAQVIAWLGAQRAASPSRAAPLAASEPSETAILGALPSPARRLVLAGIDLHERAVRLAAGEGAQLASVGPARALLQRLDRAF